MAQPIITTEQIEKWRGEGIANSTIAGYLSGSSDTVRQQYENVKKTYGDTDDAAKSFINYRYYGDVDYEPNAPPEKKGYLSRTLDRIYKDIGDAKQIALDRGLELQKDENYIADRGMVPTGKGTRGFSVVQDAARGLTQGISAILSPVTEAVSTAVGLVGKASVPLLDDPTVGERFSEAGKDIMESHLGQEYITPAMQSLAEKYQSAREGSSGEALKTLEDFGEVVIDFLDLYAVKGAGKLLRKTAQKTPLIRSIPGVGSLMTRKSDDVLELTGSAKEAVNKGMDEKFMTAVAEMNPDTKGVAAKMTVAANKGSKVMGGTVEHKEILGSVIREDVAHLIAEKERVGKVLGAMKSSVAEDTVNLTDDYFRFLDEIRNKGAVLNEKGKLISLAGAADDNIPQLQRVLDFLTPDDAGVVLKTGRDIDLWRTKMFEEMGSAKAKLMPGSPSTAKFAEDVTNGIRRSSLVKMANGNTRMIQANDAFEELATGTSKFLKGVGYKGKKSVEAVTARDLKLGEVALRNLGNASGELRPAFEEMIALTQKYGGSSTIDRMGLIKYADALEDVFPITPTRSLQGNISRGTRDAMGNFTQDIAEGKSLKAGVFNRMSEPVMNFYDKMRGLTPENRFKLLMEVLEAPPDTPLFKIIKKTLPDEAVGDMGTVKGIDAGDIKPIATAEINAGVPPPEIPKALPRKGLTGENRLAGLKTIGDVDFPSFDGFDDLSTSIVESLQGRTRVSKQFIEDLTNQGSVRQFERDMIRSTLKEFGDDVPVKDFAVSVRQQLLPLHRGRMKNNARYERITLTDDLRGKVANYSEHIYESPVKNSAGDIHFSGAGEFSPRGGSPTNYFAHTRIEDMADGKTRRVIEVQSDLFQKGRLESETKFKDGGGDVILKSADRSKYSKLEPYRNTWHERILREEIKQAAIDGKTKLQVPTGETAMKVEGLGETNTFYGTKMMGKQSVPGEKLTADSLKVGEQIYQGQTQTSDKWIITDVLGDGKFKAVTKNQWDGVQEAIKNPAKGYIKGQHESPTEVLNRYKESFDISGKVDTSNPIFRFYEKTIQKYLKNSRPDMKRVKDKQGVEWFEVPIKKEDKLLPVLAMKDKVIA